jgi:hypothetical protein
MPKFDCRSGEGEVSTLLGTNKKIEKIQEPRQLMTSLDMRSQKDPVQGLSSQRCEDITHEHSFED